jgi:hypothetical protein
MPQISPFRKSHYYKRLLSTHSLLALETFAPVEMTCRDLLSLVLADLEGERETLLYSIFCLLSSLAVC